MNNQANNPDPIPASEYPTMQPVSILAPQPVLPPEWSCIALLQPFSPLQSNSSDADAASPFFELCVAYINYHEGEFLSAQILGSSERKWWYIVTPNGTFMSTDGNPPQYPAVDLGWTLPDVNWFGNQAKNASCAGTSYLNWMKAQEVNWWKIPVGDAQPPPATWMWFDTATDHPVRLMFGQGPPSPRMGDPAQLALFQMFSFTYFPVFSVLPQPSPPSDWIDHTFPGFSFGNPSNYKLFTWSENLGMTAFMTPVNEAFNPLPTRILFTWKPDDAYKVTTDRSQNSLMMYNYNAGNSFTSQMALLTGPAPQGLSPLYSDSSFLINFSGDEISSCVINGEFDFPQEPPNWVSIPEAQGTIQACVTNNPVLCPEQTVMILSVLFPPSEPNYPDSTYLWTWYSPLNEDGSNSRPVTFMQSQSALGTGTSLALADYFYFKEFDEIDPANYAIQLQLPSGTPNSANDSGIAEAQE